MTIKTTTVDGFVESLTERIQRRIDKSRNKLRESHYIIQKDKLIIEIDRLDWVLAQINSIQNRDVETETFLENK
jgi:hypothetical protein